MLRLAEVSPAEVEPERPRSFLRVGETGAQVRWAVDTKFSGDGRPVVPVNNGAVFIDVDGHPHALALDSGFEVRAFLAFRRLRLRSLMAHGSSPATFRGSWKIPAHTKMTR